MEELLVKYGYKIDSESNEWRKDIWTIRVLFKELEVYNNPRINTPGKYYKCPYSLENLKEALDEIEELLK
jgi:hypothetical protein